MSRSLDDKPYIVRRPPGAENPRRVFNVPGVVVFIFLLTALVFALLIFAPGGIVRVIGGAGGVSPARFLAGPEANGGYIGMIAPLFTHMFLHANIPHIVFNSLWLLALGAPVARRMGADDASTSFAAFVRAFLFVLFYGLCGAAGALTFIAGHTNETTLLVGASGGVSGLLGAVVRFAFNRATILGPEYSKISPLFSPAVITWSLAIIGLNVIVGLFGGGLVGGGDSNIAWDAHIGGFLFGLVFYPAFDHTARAIR